MIFSFSFVCVFCFVIFCDFFFVSCSENGKGKPLSEFFFSGILVVFEARALLNARLEFFAVTLCEPWCPVWWAHGSKEPKHEKMESLYVH